MQAHMESGGKVEDNIHKLAITIHLTKVGSLVYFDTRSHLPYLFFSSYIYQLACVQKIKVRLSG